MAIIKCPECGNEVSEFAQSCPKCGYDIKQHFSNIQHEEKKELQRQKIGDLFNKLKQHKMIVIIFFAAVLIVLSVGIIIVNYNKKRSGYFDGITWDMTYKEVSEKYKDDSITCEDLYISFVLEDYSYYGFKADARVRVDFDNDKVRYVDVLFDEFDKAEELKEKLKKYYEMKTEEVLLDSINYYSSKNSKIYFYQSDNSVRLYYERKEQE